MEEGLNTKIERKGMKGRAWSRKKEEKKEGKERERKRTKSDRKCNIADKIRGIGKKKGIGRSEQQTELIQAIQ